MVNEIILEPHSGLANRMRMIASGIWLGSIVRKKIKLIWNLNHDLNCPFEELFEPIKNLEIIEKKKHYHFFRTVEQENIVKHFIRTLGRLTLSHYIILEDDDIKRIQAGEFDILKISNTSKTLYFNTCEYFGNYTNMLNLFIPKPEIQSRIDEHCHRFNAKTIGIHIRRTDHDLAIKYSPTEMFIKRMIDELENDPETNFFLSTDDPETEEQFIKRFGDNILTAKKEYSRNIPDGIKDALVDFYCLAKTKKIYGSYWSSFSDLATKINGIKIEKVMIDE